MLIRAIAVGMSVGEDNNNNNVVIIVYVLATNSVIEIWPKKRPGEQR